MPQELTCQSCGAPIAIENQFIRSVTCKFCGAAYLVTGGEGLDQRGKSASLGDYPSRLRVGQGGTIRGRRFTVLGRVRYAYDEGFWEEWQIAWADGQPPSWLEEDEGYWTLYTRERIRSAIPEFDAVRVGATIKVNTHDVFITEKRRARMIGSEGQFSSVLPISGDFGYLDGTANGQAVGVTYWSDELEIEVGDDLEHHEIQVD